MVDVHSKKFKRNPLIGVLGYLQLLPRGTGQVVLNKPDSDSALGSGGEAAQALSGTAVARELRKSITALYSEFVTVDGDGVDYSSLRASQEFKEYTALAAQLARVDPLTMERKERLAFFINVYNSLTIHAVATLGAPADLLSRLRLYAEASYLIGSNTFSLNDIENGILRGNRAPPTINPLPKRPFSENDPRMSLAFEEVDARIHFALNCAARSCPPIRFYKPESGIYVSSYYFICTHPPQSTNLTTEAQCQRSWTRQRAPSAAQYAYRRLQSPVSRSQKSSSGTIYISSFICTYESMSRCLGN
jgi:hypothetical protein